VISSYTQAYFADQLRTIASISTAETGFVRLRLDSAIFKPTTLKESLDFATEVALLSRNVVFEGKEGTAGAHFMIFQTPNVQQLIQGIEFRNVGQQGSLGKYPIHFHLCGDVSGSVVAKNTIRESNQRCIVVHGTNNLLIAENVAYNTKGHCFMLEDGIEVGNKFIRNIGIKTLPPERTIPNNGTNGVESDGTPATFWITNPSNTWIGNVAAGSSDTGFWFELKVRGPHADMFPDLDPKYEPIGAFEGNVAHSNYGTGYVDTRQSTVFPFVYSNA
jgi:hypothetical protein